MVQYPMNLDDLTPLKIRFAKKKPDLNDAILWYKNLLEKFPIEDHPFYWPIIKEQVPDLLVGGLYFPYDDAMMESFMTYCQEHQLFHENIEKYQQKGAAIQWNRSIALRLLALAQYDTFESYYQNTSIWDHILTGIDPRDAFDLAMNTMDKPFFVWGLFPMIALYDTHEESPRLSGQDVHYYFGMLEDQYPHLTEHASWIDVRTFHQYYQGHQEQAESFECSLDKLRFDFVKAFMAKKEECLLPLEVIVPKKSDDEPVIYYDDVFF